MFIVLLKFSTNRDQAGKFMEGHKAWLQNGFDEDTFLLAGSIEPGTGGAVVAHNTTLEALQKRVNGDPFVAGKVVEAEIVEISPSRANRRLEFLLG